MSAPAVSDSAADSALTSTRPAARRRTRRVLAACAVCAGNGLLLFALTFAGGGSADAEPKPSAEVGGAGTATLIEPFGDSERAAPGKAAPVSKEKPLVAKLKARARKLLPVRDFGGY